MLALVLLSLWALVLQSDMCELNERRAWLETILSLKDRNAGASVHYRRHCFARPLSAIRVADADG
jgi:hypothetical protein